jgi:transketolase
MDISMLNKLEKIAHDIRVDILRMFYVSGTGHMAPALSCVDIFTELYFEPVINWEERFSDKRDRVILSKGHACAALYAILARAGYFQKKELQTFYQKNTRLGGHPNILLPGIEAGTGSLGHGICFATGTAMAAKLDNESYRTYVVIGDGESQEGSVWEAAMFAGNQGLGNLTVIMDCNGLQASAETSEIAVLEPIVDKWKAFKWNVLCVNGHDFIELKDAFIAAKECMDRPTIIIADTVKGKGIRIAENQAEWHSRAPRDNEWEVICGDLNISLEDLKSI